MALTTFVDGTSTVWADFMNSIFNTGGGHKHNGGGNDGEAGKIDPATETDWGTNSAAPVKASDSVSNVWWRFNHAASGVFAFLIDALRDVQYIHSGTGTLYVGSAALTADHDLACDDLHCSDVIATGDVGGATGTFTGLLETTGQVNGDIKVTGPGTFYSVVTFHWNGAAVITDEEYGGRVSSISRGTSGQYDVTFTDDLPLGTTHSMWAASSDSAEDGEMVTTARATAADTVRVRAKNSSAGSLDPDLVHLFIPQMS